ncbi:MAG: hypothetical protein HYV09_24795 [Deltaproteobacteria bacterium]|nr:hypothetical protein [Deltaproteobacteria bacterium]
MSYRDFETELAAPWLRRRVGAAWHQALGLAKDALAEGALQAVKLRFIGGCPTDALPYAGADRSIERVPGEPVESYRARLLHAFDTWRLAGTNKGVREALATIGLTSVVIFEDKDWAASGEEGTWWMFWVVLEPPLPVGPPWTIGDGTMLGEAPLGMTGATEPLELLRRVIRKWKAAHTVCGHVILLWSGRLVGSGWSLGDGTTLGGKAAFLAL